MNRETINNTTTTRKKGDEMPETELKQCFDGTAKDFIIGLFSNSKKTTFTNEEFRQYSYEYSQKVKEKNQQKSQA